MWLADDEQAEILEQKEKEASAKGDETGAAKKGGKKAAAKRKKDVTLDDMYHEGMTIHSILIYLRLILTIFFLLPYRRRTL
jgi:hypothetical protein